MNIAGLSRGNHGSRISVNEYENVCMGYRWEVKMTIDMRRQMWQGWMFYDLGGCDFFIRSVLLLHLLRCAHCKATLSTLSTLAIIALIRALPSVSLDGAKFIFISNKLQWCFSFLFSCRWMPHQRLTKRLLLQFVNLLVTFFSFCICVLLVVVLVVFVCCVFVFAHFRQLN